MVKKQVTVTISEKAERRLLKIPRNVSLSSIVENAIMNYDLSDVNEE